ncbi:MAG TPA: hypothetical protein VLK29_13040 [Luteimonas sp.]|nr:hypothetical protein [Luteimonas sp.]
MLALLLALGGCAPEAPRITPVDAGFNASMLTGRGLDPRLYDLRERLQYHEAAHMDALSSASARVVIDAFIRAHYARDEVMRLGALAVLVYRRTAFVDYGDLVYESARDTDAGLLRGQGARLVAQVRLQRVGAGPLWTRRLVVYRDGEIALRDEQTADASRFFHE